MQNIINQLIAQGVVITNPGSVEIGPEVKADRIKPTVKIYGGCRIYGAETLMEEGAVIGREGPATIHNCYVGPNVELNGGYFAEAVFLAGAKAGLGAHVRVGTIMEEQSSIAHTVGLKQTILFPYVTLGSLINFCDCFMAGGTSRKNHSEVGSSYIHFNYTPSQHKATPSLLGDVPRGVMLNQPPIFLGGQGGMVGPCQFNFGVVTAAGIIIRKNELHSERLIFGGEGRQRMSVPNVCQAEKVRPSKTLVKANINYIANLVALRHWYKYVRSLFVGAAFSAELYAGLNLTLEKAIAERMLRLKEYVYAHWPHTSNDDWQKFELEFDDCKISHLNNLYSKFKVKLDDNITLNETYLKTIHGLDEEAATLGAAWLQAIVDCVNLSAGEFLSAI